MDNHETEFLFPIKVLPSLLETRNEAWRHLLEDILVSEERSPKRIALTLVMVRLNGCSTCNSDSYRAMRGCAACSIQSLRRFHGSDEDLVEQYESAVKEVSQYLEKMHIE